jgi:hypothetical protein
MAHPEKHTGTLSDGKGQSVDACLMLLEMVRSKAMELSHAINCDSIGDIVVVLELKSIIVLLSMIEYHSCV